MALRAHMNVGVQRHGSQERGLAVNSQGFTLGYHGAALPGLRNTWTIALLLNLAACPEHPPLVLDLRFVCKAIVNRYKIQERHNT